MAITNILDQLKFEHDKVKKLFKEAETCDVAQRGLLVQQIKEELIPHARGEEKTIYSMLKGLLDDGASIRKEVNLANEAYEEHRVIDDLLKSLEEESYHDNRWIAHLKVLQVNIEHHIEEEETELFALIKKHFSAEKLKELKDVYMTVKEDYSSTLPSQGQIKERRTSAAVPL